MDHIASEPGLNLRRAQWHGKAKRQTRYGLRIEAPTFHVLFTDKQVTWEAGQGLGCVGLP
jgi:hypothetical protein